MKLAIEWLGYPLAEEFWIWGRAQYDPLELNFIAAAEDLAAAGHECHVVANTGQADKDDAASIKGVQYHFYADYQLGLQRLKRLSPDVIVSHSAFDSHAARIATDICPKVWHVYHNDPQFTPPNPKVIPDYCRNVTAQLPYQLARLRTHYPHIRFEWYSMGVNVPLIEPYAKPHKDREWDLIFGGTYGFKGNKHCHELVPILRERGLRIGPHWMAGGLQKPDFFALCGNTRYHYYPAICDGAGRSLMEASAAGCWPIVSMQSASSLGTSPFINPKVIDGIAWVDITKDMCYLDRSVREIADDLEEIVSLPSDGYRHNLGPMDANRHKEILKKLILE